MILSEKDSVEANDDDSSKGNTAFSLSSGEIIDTSTPRKGRSVSYLELTSTFNDAGILSDSSLQRMRCLSQSINDLKILREKRQERRHEMGELLNDDFLHEHARKLKDARTKIKELEAKYQHPQRVRKFDVSSLEKRRSLSFGPEDRNENSSFSGSTGEVKTDGYCGSTQVQNGITPVHTETIESTRRPRKPRPLTWASGADFSYSSECNSSSSFGSNRQRMMEIIPENLDRNRNRCCYGYEGERTRTMENERTTAYNLSPRYNQTSATEWRSMPNLSTNENSFLENRKLMYGEAIPIDPTRTTKKHNSKFSRKSGFYTVNEIPEKSSTSSSKKRKFREKLFRRKGASKKNSQKSVSSPTEGLALGKVVRCHPGIDNAYIIELNKPDKGTFGFQISNGHEEHKNGGIFVQKIEDKKSEKFLSGLLHVGDEILEINKTNIRDESLEFVQKYIKNADKLELSILPNSLHKEP